MLHYICGLYDQLLRGSSAGLLPAVFPVLLYNGGERWTVPGNVRDLIDGSIPSRYIPAFEYYPVIERDIPDETLERVRGLVAAVVYLEKRRDAASLAGAVDAMVGMLAEERPEELRLFTRSGSIAFAIDFPPGSRRIWRFGCRPAARAESYVPPCVQRRRDRTDSRPERGEIDVC